jgi:protein O-GlcNAc transferase
MSNLPSFDTAGRSDEDRVEATGKITIGYLSNNFKNHPTAQLIRGIFKLHDRNRFNVFCYSFGENDRSSYREEIRRDCDRFVDIIEMGHVEAARRIHEDGVDVLVDLCGFTQGHRLSIAALRPAPLQVRWLGMAGTCGVDFFDYLITDEIVTPPDATSCYSETFVFMPHCYQVNHAHHKIADIAWTREDLNLPIRGPVYCCFCTHYKIDPDLFDSWMNILKRVPGSVLWLLGGGADVQKNLRRSAETRGVDSQRIVFAPKLSKSEHLARLRMADLALDTHIVNGAITTSDALYAGVPVVTCRGTHFASRMASSILHAVSLDELVADDRSRYEMIAIRLGKDPSALTSLKARLCRNIFSQPLFDTRGFVRSMEQAYTEMWNRHRQGRPKRIIRASGPAVRHSSGSLAEK